MQKAAAWVGAYPIGPKCLEKMSGKRLAVHSKVVKSDQPDLFGEENEQIKYRKGYLDAQGVFHKVSA